MFQEEKLKNYNVLIDGRNFYDQPINDLVKQYDYYTTGCLSDYAYFKDHYRLIAFNVSKQKALDAYPRAIQQIVFQGILGGENNTKIRLYTIPEQSKEAILELAKGTAKIR